MSDTLPCRGGPLDGEDWPAAAALKQPLTMNCAEWIVTYQADTDDEGVAYYRWLDPELPKTLNREEARRVNE